MRNTVMAGAILALIIPATGPAIANEAEFLQTLEGAWSGGGSIRLNPEDEAMQVSCDFQSGADGAKLVFDGSCRAMVVFSRQIGAEIEHDGSSYSGVYTGARRGPAQLSGQRAGDALQLSVQWPDQRSAQMELARLGPDQMQLVTREEHPETGEQIVTAQIDLSRQ